LGGGQSSLPLVPGSPAPESGERLEIEQVEVNRFGALPREIHRKAGRFLLLMTNRSQDSQEAGFVVDPAGVGDLKLGQNPLLRLGAKSASDGKHRSAALFDATAGSFDLKDAKTGKVVCRFTFE